MEVLLPAKGIIPAMARFARYAWGVLAYNLAVILWGAIVRATGSGSGCGSHWPLCNGEVVPRAAQVATLIEFSHRLTSGVALLLVLGLVMLARRDFPAGHAARFWAWASFVFILGEAAVGAGLVLFELVADNQSMARAMFMGSHLVNTFFLLAALALTAHHGGREAPTPRAAPPRPAFLAALAGMLLLGSSGAVAALGDTLFPVGTLQEALSQDLSPTSHLLIRLRILHPSLAVVVGLGLLALAVHAARADGRLARAVGGLVIAQTLAGGLNVALLAPIALQILHLLLADLLWIALVLLTEISRAAAMAPAPTAGETAPAQT
jgi:heme A synthase